MSDELQEMQREWREQVTANLTDLRQSVDLMRSDLHQLTLDVVSKSEHAFMGDRLTIVEKRVTKLEGDRRVALAIFAVVQAVVAAGFAVAMRVFLG